MLDALHADDTSLANAPLHASCFSGLQACMHLAETHASQLACVHALCGADMHAKLQDCTHACLRAD
ncbi:hypothetical protein Xbuh_11980 [Xanthomonas axonopodis pv. bauhiniae]|nr:hypothetical protein Xbuh_11980 [Xanthomonas axonopodis pv. bauhiniae]CEH39437.1 hypothetical protein XACG102_10740001 [Xanthomonas citri pv. citri]